MAIYFMTIYKHIYFWKKATFAAFCVALRSTMVLCSEVACSYFGLSILSVLCVCLLLQISEKEGGSLKIKKNDNFVPMGFISCLCVIFLCARKKYLNNPVCTVSRSLVLNAVISSERRHFEKCICLQSDMYNLLQCKKQNPSFVSFLSCG